MDTNRERGCVFLFVDPYRRAALTAKGVDVIEEPPLGDAQHPVPMVVLLGAYPAVSRIARNVDEVVLEVRRRQRSHREPTHGFGQRLAQVNAADVEIGVLVLHPSVDGAEARAPDRAVWEVRGGAPRAHFDGRRPTSEELRGIDAVPGGHDRAWADEPAGTDRAGAGGPAHSQGADHSPRRKVCIQDADPVVGWTDDGLERAPRTGARQR